MQIENIDIQKCLTESLNLEFILAENLNREIELFQSWFLESIDKYSSEKTKIRYNLTEFVPFFDGLDYSCLITHSDLRNYRFLYSLKKTRIENYNDESYDGPKCSKHEYEEALKEINGINKNIEIFDRLVNERQPFIGSWRGLDLLSYLIKETEQKWKSIKDNEIVLNPSLDRFLKNEEVLSFLKKRFDWLLDVSNNEDRFKKEIRETLDDLITLLKSKINSDVDCLFKNTKRYLVSEKHGNDSKFLINIGFKVTKDHTSSKFRTDFYDHYAIFINNKEFTYRKRVDFHSPDYKVVSLFVVNTKHIVHLLISPEKLLERSEYIIKKDVKKLNIVDSILEIHYHGHFSPDSIVFDNYESALEMQRYITNQRY